MLVVWPTCFAASIAGSFAFDSGTALGTLLGVAAVAVVITAYGTWIQSRRRLAVAVPEWFGVEIRRREMPMMGRVDQFDAWCRKRNLSAVARRSDTDVNSFA